MNYRATRNDLGQLVVHRVPIFVACKRGETDFNDDWIENAVRSANQAELEGYLPPLHIRHHDDGPQPEPAGFFRIVGHGPITFKGKQRTAIFADLTITRGHLEQDILSARLPYRSVEIFDVDVPQINSLALLDHEPPYLELPMLMVATIDGEPVTSESNTHFASAKFRNPYAAEGVDITEPVVACFRRGHSAQLFFQDVEPMAAKKSSPTKSRAPQAKKAHFADSYDEPEEKMEADEGDSEDKGENMESDALDVSAVVKAISDGSISVADMEAIKAAIMEMTAVAEPEEEEAEPVAEIPTPGDALRNKASNGQSFAAMQGKIDALEAKLQARESSEKRKSDVAEAMKRLEGRPMGADIEGKLEKFHKGHGPLAFKDYVDSICSQFAARAGLDGSAEDFRTAVPVGASKVAMAYTELGTDAVAKATQFSREWSQLHGRQTRMSEERYVEINMNKVGFKK